MTKTSVSLQDLGRGLYVKAKAEPSWRFWGLYVHVCKTETLRDAYELARINNGAPGVDGVTFEAIEEQGVEAFVEQIRGELVERTYRPLPARRREIPKACGESFGFLGFDFRRVRSTRNKVWRPHLTPKLKKRTSLLRTLKEAFRRHKSQPVERVVELINPVLRGWVNYFAVGNSSKWQMSSITFSAGKPHARFDVAGAGNVTTVAGLRPLAKAMEQPPEPNVRAPVLDPTSLVFLGITLAAALFILNADPFPGDAIQRGRLPSCTRFIVRRQ